VGLSGGDVGDGLGGGRGGGLGVLVAWVLVGGGGLAGGGMWG